jgi:hypothetical protein
MDVGRPLFWGPYGPPQVHTEDDHTPYNIRLVPYLLCTAVEHIGWLARYIGRERGTVVIHCMADLRS